MNIRIGYCFWGFLGNGILDTPDGGRSHRADFIRGLISRGYEIIMLQSDRDLVEAGENIRIGQTYCSGFPKIDFLFLEWRWLIEGRNDNENSPDFTPDLFRQREVLEYYKNRVPVIVWDKDQQLDTSPSYDIGLLLEADSYILEPSLYPSAKDRISALIPVDANRFIAKPQRGNRKYKLVYIGNQYDRDEMYYQFLVKAAEYLEVNIFGKWEKPARHERLVHHGRIPFREVYDIYSQSVATIMLAPKRYMDTGQYTQRIFESIINGCVPIVPKDYRGNNNIFLDELIVNSAEELIEKVQYLTQLKLGEWENLITLQISKLKPFHLENILDTIQLLINSKE